MSAVQAASRLLVLDRGHLGGGAPFMAFARRLLGGVERRYYLVVHNRDIAGIATIRDIRKEVGMAEVSLRLQADFRGLGVGSAAYLLLRSEAERLNLARLTAWTMEDNVAGQAALRNAGFRSTEVLGSSAQYPDVRMWWCSAATLDKCLENRLECRLPPRIPDAARGRSLADLARAFDQPTDPLYALCESAEPVQRRGAVYIRDGGLSPSDYTRLRHLLLEERHLGTDIVVVPHGCPVTAEMRALADELSVCLVTDDTVLDRTFETRSARTTGIRAKLRATVLHELGSRS